LQNQARLAFLPPPLQNQKVWIEKIFDTFFSE